MIRIGAGESTRPAPTGSSRWPAASRSSPAPRAASARRSPRTLARDGATSSASTSRAQGEDLAEVVNEIGGSSLLLDITDEDAPARLAEHLRERHGGVDVVVHNAGVTRDRTLGRMTEDEWDMVLAINLTAQERINDVLLDGGVLRPGGRIVTVSSMSGIAGNRGQANYATSKAGVIGIVESLAPVLAERGQTINAVAPGLHRDEDDRRDAGRHARGGPADELASPRAACRSTSPRRSRWLASPASGGVNGNVVRVCGQSLIGA